MVAIPAGIRLSEAPVRGCPLTGKPCHDRAGFARGRRFTVRRKTNVKLGPNSDAFSDFLLLF